MSEEKFGYQNLKEVAILGMALAEAGLKAYEDKELTLSDLQYAWEPLKKIAPAIQDIDQVIDEFKDLSENEHAQMFKELKEGFDLSDDQLEERIESYVDLGLKFAQIIASFIK